ncbi:AMP-binding protein [Tautonia plasticadhaerens]|uniref:Long-chain-fatty-acid--CoA ligase n=1 Tax=Tautonia plasticadhaerens TaxID=2527974 RepID=A0A518HES6_9BACT|nr:AMP-binding protein [Tautonia plasticadhaerens]QDV39353.1 Long-chain-fatty-acid--CoA ligase [Tautonia plasticadhaerens]
MGEPHAPWVDGLTIGQALRASAGRFGEREAIVFPLADFRCTYEAFDRQIDAVARGLIGLGFGRGDRFGVWSTNWPEWVLLQFSAARVGVVLVTINPSYRASEAKYALAQSEVLGLGLIARFKTSAYFEMLAEICPELAGSTPGALHSAELPHLRWVVALRGDPPPGMLGWGGLVDAGRDVPPEALAEREAQILPEDPINLQYTSGTTGFPKGAVLSHRNLLLNAFYAGRNMRLDHRDRIGIPVPLYHCFGCVLGTLVSAVYGAAMVFPHEAFRPEATLDALERERCTAVYGVPTMFIAMFEHPSYAGRDLGALRTGIMAGSPCPIELMRRVTTEMGAEEITIGYGQTEASPLISQTRWDDPIELRVGTVGCPLPGVEVRIVDPVTGRECPDGTSGELCARGHCVMQGYFNMPDRTAEVIDPEGWLHTGDLAMREPNGYIRITGRLKDMIIRGGENIAPREVEELLYRHPKVEDVQVVGVPSRTYGEEVLACVKLRAGQSATEDEIRDFCAASLAHFKVPRYVQFLDAFPTTVTGKIQKYKLREQAVRAFGLEADAGIETA